jgi:hypothetical protein
LVQAFVLGSASAYGQDEELTITIQVDADAAVKTGYKYILVYDTAALSYVDNSLILLEAGSTLNLSFSNTVFDYTFEEKSSGRGNSIEGYLETTSTVYGKLLNKTGGKFTIDAVAEVGSSLSSGTPIVSLKLKTAQAGNFTADTLKIYTSWSSPVSTDLVEARFSIAPEDDGGNDSDSEYTITPTGEANATAGVPFDVAVTLTADPEINNLGSLEAYLTYTGDVIPDLTGLSGDEANPRVTQSGEEKKLAVSYTLFEDDNSSFGAEPAAVVTIPFTAQSAGTATFTVTGGKVSLSPYESPMSEAESGDPLTVTIAAAAAPITYDATYEGAPEGYTLLKYELTDASTKVWTYAGQPMHYAKIENEHYVTYLVTTTVANGNDALGEIKVTETDITAFNGDVDGDGEVEIIDAQLTYELFKGLFNSAESLSTVSIAARLSADANNDGQIDKADALAVQTLLHAGK